MNKFKKKWIKYCSVTTLIIIVISLIAGIVAHRLPIAENGLDFFANFGGAAIAATIAAALVVYQSIQSHLDVEEEIEQGKQRQIEQQKHENELEQAMAFNRTRPMLYVIAKHYYSKNIERVNPGDRFFIWSKVLDEKSESAAEFIANLDVQNGSESGGLFEIRLFNGEPIHRIKIVFKKLENFDRGSTMYIPYLEPNKRNVIITKDMLLHPWFKADKTRKPGAPKEINNLIREPQSGDTYCSMPRTDVLNFVLSEGLTIDFDTVLQEHVHIDYESYSESEGLGDPTITLSYNDENFGNDERNYYSRTQQFMKNLIESHQVPTEEAVRVSDEAPKRFPMQKTEFTAIYEVPNHE